MNATTNTQVQPNPSYNSYRCKLSSAEQRIFNMIAKSADAVFPKQIADELGMKQGSVRPILRIMLHKHVIFQPYKGAYCDRITYEVRFHPVLVHNVRLHFLVEERLESWEFSEKIGGVDVFCCFGSERGKVSGRISFDRGMNRAACMLAVDRWISIAEGHLGREIKDLVLTACEVNKDYLGLKLEGGVHCVTKRVLKDTLERIYEKEEGVRHEYRIMKNMTLTEFDQIFDKGLDQILGVASNLDNQQELGELRKAQTFMNRRMLETQSSIQAIEKKIVGQAVAEDRVPKLENLVAQLAIRVDELTRTNESLTQTLLKLLAPKEPDVSSGSLGVSQPLKSGQDYSR